MEDFSIESPRGITMLRCRRCRKGFIDSTCLYPIATADESTAAQCSIWHVNVDTLPEWILTSVHQAQWTVGKLNCQNCGARLGGFNFINHSRCPCGQDITVHLSKSRVDQDHKRSIHMVQPRRTRPEKEQGCLQVGQESFRNEHESAQLNRDSLVGSQLGCAVPSYINPETQTITTQAEASHRLINGEATQSLPLHTQCCISHRKRCRLEDDASSSISGLFPSSPTDNTQVEVMRTGTQQSAHSPMVYHTTHQLDTGVSGSINSVACHSVASREMWSVVDQQHLSTVEGLVPSGIVPAQPEEVSDSPMFLRGRTISDSMGEQEEDIMHRASTTSPAPNRLSKREKNRLKSHRRKQRRRERWIHSQLEQEQSASGLLTDSEEEDREGYTCAVCLDVYYSPYSCHPCGHVFCEPCLRTLAKNRPTNTPCPLCRTLISHTLFQKELNQTAKTFFPKVYHARKQNFQRATCAKWPLPNCRKRFRIFWGYQRQAAAADRRWHFAPAGFTLDALDLADMRGWLFDIDLVIIYIHSVNWILAFLLLCFLIYFFFS
ncbi:E3 ubiquitin-protein ligase RNF180 [Polymixia lowei]